MGRQVKACTSCRTAKIRCTMADGADTCERCQARGLPCNTEKNPQTFVQEAARWQTSMAEQVAQLQTAVNVLLRVSELPALSSYSPSSPASNNQTASRPDEAEEADEEPLHPEPILTPVAIEDDSFYSLPINSLYQVTRLHPLGRPSTSSKHARLAQDFISRGLLSEAAAQQCFSLFTNRLNYFCYGILCPYDTLEELRKSSTLLTAAICAVASLHDPEASSRCRATHTEYLRLVSATMFSSSPTADDIRAFIVGAYWLGNTSFTLLGHAIRTATRLNHHLAYFAVVKAGTGQAAQDDVDNARLWYTLYILDHHASIIYGRPALISANEEPHQQWELFIGIGGTQEIDLRLSSQVALYHIISKVNDVFGGYAVKAVPEHSLPQLRNFFAELERWYITWGNRMPRNAHVGWFPRDGAILHYHFARLHLCSYVFRGMALDASPPVSPQVAEFASVAVSSAFGVLEIVLERDDMRTALVGMPLYFHGMITFAAVFLIKATRNNFQGLATIDTQKVFDLVERCVAEMRSQSAARQHLVYHLSDGLDAMMSTAKKEISDLQGALMDVSHRTMDSMFVMNTFDLLQAPIDPQFTVSDDQIYPWRDEFQMQL